MGLRGAPEYLLQRANPSALPRASHPRPSRPLVSSPRVQAFYCWARDIAVVNCDSGIFIDKSVGIEVRGFRASQTAPRDPKKPKSIGDAHWGVHTGEGEVGEGEQVTGRGQTEGRMPARRRGARGAGGCTWRETARHTPPPPVPRRLLRRRAGGRLRLWQRQLPAHRGRRCHGAAQAWEVSISSR